MRDISLPIVFCRVLLRCLVFHKGVAHALLTHCMSYTQLCGGGERRGAAPRCVSPQQARPWRRQPFRA